jgi:hypothetical protein
MPNRHPLDHPLVIFQPSRIHGMGGFAWVDLRKGQRIIESTGCEFYVPQKYLTLIIV